MKFCRASKIIFLLIISIMAAQWAYANNPTEASSSVHLPIIKLSPQARVMFSDVKTIDYAQLKPYFTNSEILPRKLLLNMPYVLAFADDHLVLGKNDSFYARGFDGRPLVPQDCRGIHQKDCYEECYSNKVPAVEVGQRWQVVRIRDSYIDPIIQRPLGTFAEAVGQAEVVRLGDPVTLRLVQSTIELKMGDRLLPMDAQIHHAGFEVFKPNTLVEGEIIDVLDGVTNVGAYQTVVLNIGKERMIHPGALLTIYRPGKPVNDRMARKMVRYAKPVPLPNEPVGALLVYRVFEHTSLGLVLKADLPMKISYLVRSESAMLPPMPFAHTGEMEVSSPRVISPG